MGKLFFSSCAAFASFSTLACSALIILYWEGLIGPSGTTVGIGFGEGALGFGSGYFGFVSVGAFTGAGLGAGFGAGFAYCFGAGGGFGY